MKRSALNTLRYVLVRIMLLLRGIVIFVCGGIGILILILLVVDHFLHLGTDMQGTVVLIITMVLSFGAIWVYDKLIFLVKPDDMDIYLNM